MPDGTANGLARRLRDPAFHTRYFVGHGIDVGAGPYGLSRFARLFARCERVTDWDRQDGDATDVGGLPDDLYDFLFSSHCLEHLPDPLCALQNWVRVVKPGGHVIVLVPDEDMYEQHVWPSAFNAEHQTTFTLWKARSWSPVSVNVLDLVRQLPQAELIKAERLEATFLEGGSRRRIRRRA